MAYFTHDTIITCRFCTFTIWLLISISMFRGILKRITACANHLSDHKAVNSRQESGQWDVTGWLLKSLCIWSNICTWVKTKWLWSVNFLLPLSIVSRQVMSASSYPFPDVGLRSNNCSDCRIRKANCLCHDQSDVAYPSW